MLTMFLETVSTLVNGLLTNVYSGSLMPGIDGVTGSMVSAIELS
jgi:hypothetical protein